MKITQQELIEFADEQGLKVFGNSKIVMSKIRTLHRLINRGLIPKPIWKGGTSAGYWENDTEIKDRILWLDEQREKGVSYKKIKILLSAPSKSSDALTEIEPILKKIDLLIEIHPEVADNYYIKATLYEKVGELNKALELFEYVLAKNEKDEKLVPLLFESIIPIYHIKEKKEEEKNYCERYIEFVKDKHDEVEGRAYLSMAEYFMDIDAQSSLQYFQKAEKLITSDELLAELYGSISLVERDLKDTEKAKEHALKAIELYPENSINQAHAKANYHIFLYDEGKYEEALECLLEAKEILSHHKDILNEVIITTNIGKIYRKMGDYKKALQMFRFSINNLDPTVDPPSYKFALKELSIVYSEIGDEKKSKFYQEEHEKIDITYLGQNK